MERPKFPHLEHLSHARMVLDAPTVTVTEKIDGFNARCGRDADGTFWVGTRNQIIDPASDAQQGWGPFALTLADALDPGLTLFGEWAGKGVQKRIDYGDKAFYLFDGFRDGEWIDRTELVSWAVALGLRMPRLFYEGPPPPVADLESWRDTPGIEGVVVRAYPMAVDRYGHSMIAKFKSAAFAETSSQKASRSPADMDLAAGFVAEYVTDERLRHVVSFVAEDGTDALHPTQTGAVLRAMYQDITREGAADFAALPEDQQKFVGKLSAKATIPLLAELRGELLAA